MLPTIIKGKSKAETGKLGKNSDIINFFKDQLNENEIYFMIIYKVNEVLSEKYSKNAIDNLKEIIEPKYLKELRIFSDQSELYLWKTNEGLSYRFRRDGIGDPVNIYQENHIIWGTNVDKDNVLSEKLRGVKIKLPFSTKINESDLPLKYQVNNYFEKDVKYGLIKFYDSRLVKFLTNNGGEIND